MKKYLLAAALVMVSTCAMADRMVSASRGSSNIAFACGSAKYEASQSVRMGEHVEKYSECSCDQNGPSAATCNVDATISSSTTSGRTVTGEGSSSAKAIACDSAKYDARKKAYAGEEVEQYSRCFCVENAHDSWSCNVDALLGK
jgi:hypothetical protein